MTIASPPKSFDRPLPPSRGGAAAGMLSELPSADACAVLAFRLWCDGMQTDAPASIAAFCTLAQGVAQTQSFAQLIAIMIQSPRRPIMHHGLTSACFGGDEAVFSHVIAAATCGDHEDPMAVAMLLTTPAAAWQAVLAAKPVGLALLGLCRTAPIQPAAARHLNQQRTSPCACL
ncbi:MAG: hypothetical protein WAT09_15070 [Paracoccaceae bacterium]